MNMLAKRVVLVVEDDPLIQIHSQLVLEDAGFEVIQASDAGAALARLDERPDISALFTDVRITGAMDGIELAEVIHERRPDIAIVVTSGNAEILADRLPGNGRFVAKPYTVAQLTRLIGAPQEAAREVVRTSSRSGS